MLEANAAAPEFDLLDLSGERRSLRQILSSGTALLAFLKVSCPVCQYTFPFLERLHRGGGKSAPRLIAISQDDAGSTMEFTKAFGITFPTLLDPEGEGYGVSNAFGLTNVPSLFLVETDGRISRAVNGFVKAELQDLGSVFGVAPFREGEKIPALRPG